MIYTIIIIALLITAFYLCIGCFIYGVKCGKQIQHGNIPQPIKIPVKMAIEAVERHEKNKKVEEVDNDLSSIMNYSMDTALEAIKRGN